MSIYLLMWLMILIGIIEKSYGLILITWSIFTYICLLSRYISTRKSNKLTDKIYNLINTDIKKLIISYILLSVVNIYIYTTIAFIDSPNDPMLYYLSASWIFIISLFFLLLLYFFSFKIRIKNTLIVLLRYFCLIMSIIPLLLPLIVQNGYLFVLQYIFLYWIIWFLILASPKTKPGKLFKKIVYTLFLSLILYIVFLNPIVLKYNLINEFLI